MIKDKIEKKNNLKKSEKKPESTHVNLTNMRSRI
jgi:hypothetical protein